MNIVTYLDNDKLNRPCTGNAPVYAVGEAGSPSAEQLVQQYPTVFSKGVGRIEGQYHIRLDESISPVQHAPRRVPVALRETLQHTLTDMTKQEIITPVQQPTPWISSMVVVPKSNGNLRICLDPQDLNRAVLREHYPLPTIEEIATRLCGAKLFSVLDVRNGFWHIELDEPSSLLTTFHTPFGRYRWRRMPFGISSAPEVFQQRMHQLIERLKGVEVVADDFLIAGYGDNKEAVAHDHDGNLVAFLQRCSERGVKLNPEKMRLRLREVPFIGHVVTDKGLRADAEKARAIAEMPPPTDVKGVQRLLGMIQYLSKFLPSLSDMTKPLRDLTQKETEWVWDTPQQTAFEKLKQAVGNTPVLRFYNLQEEVTLQCDASQHGLGATMMQNGQPIAYASRALTSAETRYAQIEELLAIVFACDHFHAYVFGRDNVNVETDHQPLEMIVRKPLNSAPKRLQRMLLQLQKYSLTVRYKKGKLLYIADTLSRAPLPDTKFQDWSKEVATVTHASYLALPGDRLHQFQHVSADDPVLMELRKTILQGWPEEKSALSDALHAYYDFRDELTVEDTLVFKGPVVVVPAALRKEMMATCHDTHIGIEGCLRRARESMFWPRMTSDLKSYISKCDICMAHQATNPKETLQPHDFIPRPWSKVGADLCEFYGRNLLVVSDYFSNFIEVENLQTTTTRVVTKALKIIFARYGIPDTLVTDNGPQFTSAEFVTFTKKWSFDHITSSPHFPQSNGKAENAVKTVKRLFSKCRDAGKSEFQALLDWRNTPTEGVGTSPAQRLFGRRCKTLLPVTHKQLETQYSTEDDARALVGQKAKQKHYHDRGAKDLTPIPKGDTIRMRLPGQKTWTPGTCLGQCAPRSYRVRVDAREFRRNRRQLLHAGEQPPPDIPEPEQDTTAHEGEQQETLIERPEDPVQLETEFPETTQTPPVTPGPTPLRRSGRIRRQPERIMNYVPS